MVFLCLNFGRIFGYTYLYIERKESVRIHKLELFTGKLWLYLGFLLTLHSIFKFLKK